MVYEWFMNHAQIICNWFTNSLQMNKIYLQIHYKWFENSIHMVYKWITNFTHYNDQIY